MRFEPDLEKLREVWGEDDAVPVKSFDDFLSIAVDLPDGSIHRAQTHLFGKETKIVPYDDLDENVRDAEDVSYPRGDIALAEVIRPGEIAFMMRHHRPMRSRPDGEAFHNGRRLSPGQTPDQMRAHLKLQDTHIGILIGVANRHDTQHPGVIGLHNPQCYPTGKERISEENIEAKSRRRFGRFGGEGEEANSMVLFKPRFPASIQAQDGLVTRFTDNIRTMLVGFNTVADYPFDSFDGADPLGAHDVVGVREHVTQMVRAIAGNDEALAWFREPANLIYCSELAHLATSAGLHCPLNAKVMVPLVGKETWETFSQAINAHNRGETTRFRSLNKNHRVQDILLTQANEDLKPLADYVDTAHKERAQTRLAFPALTAEGLAHYAQVELLPPTPPTQRRAAPPTTNLLGWFCPDLDLNSRGLEDDTNYEEILFAKPRPGLTPADSLFVPPSLFHLIAKGHCKGGLLDLDYVGHGLHFSLVKRVD